MLFTVLSLSFSCEYATLHELSIQILGTALVFDSIGRKSNIATVMFIGDSLSYHAGQKFSTFDADNDEWKDGACALEHGGAWWYKECDKRLFQ